MKSKYKGWSEIRIGGIVIEKKNKITKNNNMMAFITLEDFFGTIECIVFPQTYVRYYDLINEDEVVVIEGRLSFSEVEEPKIICEKVAALNKLNLDKIYVKITRDKDKDIFNRINLILKKNPGDTPVYLYLEKDKKTLIADRSLWVNSDFVDTIKELEALLGKGNVVVS